MANHSPKGTAIRLLSPEALAVRPAWLAPRVMRTEALAGLVVAIALIPEAISFSIIAGVDPRVGLFASVTMAITIAFTGGRPAMISAATGAIALVVAPLAKAHGIEYLVAAVLLGGALQVALAAAGVARLMRFVPRSVMVGFVNALAILIFLSQLPYLIDVPGAVYPMVAVGLFIILAMPRLTTAIPGPLVAVVGLAIVAIVFGINVPTVSDQGELPTSLPSLMLPDVPLTLETLRLVGPVAVAIALVGLLESLLTAKLVDDITDTRSNKTRESWGQGVANIVTGLFGGMGGCAMIGQTMINVRSGARTRLSTFLAGAFLLILVVALGDVVGLIPMAALVAVMIVVSYMTFDWHSLRSLPKMPRSETIVMLITVVGTVVTKNLAIGVIAGVLTACLLFARRVAHVATMTSELAEDGLTRTYFVHGALFFASSNDLVYQFDYADDPERVIIDLSDAQIWDASTVASLDAVVFKYERHEKIVDLVGLDRQSSEFRHRLEGLMRRAS